MQPCGQAGRQAGKRASRSDQPSSKGHFPGKQAERAGGQVKHPCEVDSVTGSAKQQHLRHLLARTLRKCVNTHSTLQSETCLTCVVVEGFESVVGMPAE